MERQTRPEIDRYLQHLLTLEPEKAGENYRHASHMELLAFMGLYCWKCKREYDYINTHSMDDACDILSRASNHAIGHPDYPSEWTYGNNGSPTCTAFDEAESSEGEGG